METPQAAWQDKIEPFDDRRDIAIPGDQEARLSFCLAPFLSPARQSIQRHGSFSVALSGGNTPKALFSRLKPNDLEWNKVLLFWSDERCVSPENPESNYHMAMEAGFRKLSLDPTHIFRMHAEEEDLEKAARNYENDIKKNLGSRGFDFVMLGMGDDGHIASLFPKTHALHAHDRLVVSNYVEQKGIWRMTFTYACINQASHIAIYVLGDNKAATVAKVLEGPYDPDLLPAQKVGTPEHKVLWIMDNAAAKNF